MCTFKRFVYIKHESISEAFGNFTEKFNCNYILYVYIFERWRQIMLR